MRARYILAGLAITAPLAGAGIGYTYVTVKPLFERPISNYQPDIHNLVCNGDFSPSVCVEVIQQVGHIPEPGTYALFGLGLALMMLFRRVMV